MSETVALYDLKRTGGEIGRFITLADLASMVSTPTLAAVVAVGSQANHSISDLGALYLGSVAQNVAVRIGGATPHPSEALKLQLCGTSIVCSSVGQNTYSSLWTKSVFINEWETLLSAPVGQSYGTLVLTAGAAYTNNERTMLDTLKQQVQLILNALISLGLIVDLP